MMHGPIYIRLYRVLGNTAKVPWWAAGEDGRRIAWYLANCGNIYVYIHLKYIYIYIYI